MLVPGARSDAIHTANVDRISAHLIVPAANIPFAAGTVPRLHARAIVAVPDFVANAGGVLIGLVGMQGGSAEDVFRAVRERIGANVRLILDAARLSNCSAYDAALSIAHQRLAHTMPAGT